MNYNLWGTQINCPPTSNAYFDHTPHQYFYFLYACHSQLCNFHWIFTNLDVQIREGVITRSAYIFQSLSLCFEAQKEGRSISDDQVEIVGKDKVHVHVMHTCGVANKGWMDFESQSSNSSCLILSKANIILYIKITLNEKHFR